MTRIYTDHQGRCVNAITREGSDDTEGALYQIYYGRTSLNLRFQKGAIDNTSTSTMLDTVNGITNEALLEILMHRINLLHKRVESVHNTRALDHLARAADALREREMEQRNKTTPTQ